MQERLQKEDDIKIFILFLMYNLKMPLEYETINDVVVQDGIVGGIDFAVAFADLLENGNIEQIHTDNTVKFRITRQGIHIVESLQGDLTNAIRTQGLKSAMRLLDLSYGGSEIKTRYCEIIEAGESVFQIKLIADNSTQLELMRYTFDDKPEMIYKGVLTLLTGKGDYFLS